MAASKEYKIDLGNDEFAIVEWPGNGDPILLLHATGFHSRCWREVIKYLPGRHIYAVDLRFHGGSGDTGETDWGLMAQDIHLLIERLELDNIVAVGHSIGGHLVARVIGHFVDRVILKNERGLGIGYFVVSILAQIVLGILASTVVMWFSRQREFRADAGAARLAGANRMVAALERLKSGALRREFPSFSSPRAHHIRSF